MNLRHFRSTHCFTVKWKSALNCTFLVQLPEKTSDFSLHNSCFLSCHRVSFYQDHKTTTFRPVLGLVSWFFDADFKFNQFFKKILSLLYFLLTLYSIFTQLVRKFDPICLLRTLLYSILRLSIFTHTLGKIHFLLCFACFINLWVKQSFSQVNLTKNS